MARSTIRRRRAVARALKKRTSDTEPQMVATTPATSGTYPP
jgi:hypothetical protein